MVKGKYLAVLFVLFLGPRSACATAWMPKIDSYKLSLTTLLISSSSNMEKRQRADLLHKVEQLIYHLEHKLRNTNTDSARYHLLANIIKSLQKTALELTSYQDDFLTMANIEYGLKENQSFGLNLSYKQNSFSSSKSSFSSCAKIAEFFYKYRLLQNNNYILSVQPKFIINNNHRNKGEISSELALFFGTSYQVKKSKCFMEIGLSNINGIYGNYSNRKEYGFSISEAIKMPKAWMLLHYTKYNFRNNAKDRKSVV